LSSLTLISVDPGSDGGRVTPAGWEPPDLDEFEFFVPLDCPTSIPVASSKRHSKEDSLVSRVADRPTPFIGFSLAS
jgi:hypothetical protein